MVYKKISKINSVETFKITRFHKPAANFVPLIIQHVKHQPKLWKKNKSPDLFSFKKNTWNQTKKSLNFIDNSSEAPVVDAADAVAAADDCRCLGTLAAVD